MLREARRQHLPEPQRKCLAAFASEIANIENKKNKKRIQLQSTLTDQPDVYDNHWIGDSIETKKQKAIRIWYQNCNGLIQQNDIRAFQFDIATLADLGVNYFSFSETCVNINKPGYVTKLNSAFNEVIPNGYFKSVNSPAYPKRSNYQPGGISAGYDATMRTRILKEGQDPFGRWMWQEFGQNSMVTRIYTLYRVNAGSEYASGNCTAWYQQKLQIGRAHV